MSNVGNYGVMDWQDSRVHDSKISCLADCMALVLGRQLLLSFFCQHALVNSDGRTQLSALPSILTFITFLYDLLGSLI